MKEDMRMEYNAVTGQDQPGMQDSMEISLWTRLEGMIASYQKDALTGLWNREYFAEFVDEILAEPENEGTLFLMRLVGLREVKEQYGHIMGDTCLAELSKLLTKSVREADLLGFLGGEEFGIFLRGRLAGAAGRRRAQMLSDSYQEAARSLGIDCPVTVMVGSAVAPGQGKKFRILYRKAEARLAQALAGQPETSRKLPASGNVGKDQKLPAAGGGSGVAADLALVKEFVSESRRPGGAFEVEYEGFRHIYQFLARYLLRSDCEIQMILFSLEQEGGGQEEAELSGILFDLEQVIKGSLRMGDVATGYSSTQYLVILMDATHENAAKVAERVGENFKPFAEQYGVRLAYDIDKLDATSGQKEEMDIEL